MPISSWMGPTSEVKVVLVVLRSRKALVTAMVVGLVMILALGVSGCGQGPDDGEAPAGDASGSGDGGDSGGNGDSGGDGGDSTAGLELTLPGSGLPVDLPSGVLAFGLHSVENPETMALVTIDFDGGNLTRWCALSPYDRQLLLSPDGTKLATFNGGKDNYDSDLTFWVYDLVAGTLTKLPRPEGDPYPGFPATFCWSLDSKDLIYTCSLIGVDDGDRLARVPADGSQGRFVEGISIQAFQDSCMAPVPNHDEVLYTDDDSIDGFSLHAYDFTPGQARTILDSGIEKFLTVSPDGRRAAFFGFDRTGGSSWEHKTTIVDLASGQLVQMPQLEHPYSVVGYVWSPTGDRVAMIWENADTYPAMVGLTVYDTAGEVKCTTEPIDTLNDDTRIQVAAGVVWAPDGQSLFVPAGPTERPNRDPGSTTIYCVDASTGEFVAIFTAGEGEGIRGLLITP